MIYQFGLPEVLIIDIGHRFSGMRCTKFCLELGIAHHFTSVGNLQANGEAEVTNQTFFFQDLKSHQGVMD